MAVSGFNCYITYQQIAELIPDETERGMYWCALMEYMFYDISKPESEYPIAVGMALVNAKSHLKTSKNRGQNAKKNQNESKQIKTNQNESNLIKSEQDKDKGKDKDKDKYKDKGDGEVIGVTCPDDCRATLRDLGMM